MWPHPSCIVAVLTALWVAYSVPSVYTSCWTCASDKTIISSVTSASLPTSAATNASPTSFANVHKPKTTSNAFQSSLTVSPVNTPTDTAFLYNETSAQAHSAELLLNIDKASSSRLAAKKYTMQVAAEDRGMQEELKKIALKNVAAIHRERYLAKALFKAGYEYWEFEATREEAKYAAQMKRVADFEAAAQMIDSLLRPHGG